MQTPPTTPTPHTPSLALEVRALHKRFTVGYGACLASADVLRGIDLSVAAGELVLLIGGEASGKSTLMLCAAGLLRADAGDISWFGSRSPISAARRVLYHLTPNDLMRSGALGEPKVHLVDTEAPAEWITARRDQGDAVLVAARHDVVLESLASRVLVLTRGVLQERSRRWPRVAEGLASAR